jgi:anti-sigma factor RsiW
MAKSAPLNDEDREQLIAFLDGELDEKAARLWEARLQRDPHARAEAEALSRTWQLLDYLPQPEPSATFSSRTLDRVSVLRPVQAKPRTARRWPPWLLGGGWAAGVVIAALLGFAMVNRPSPAPSEPVAEADPADLEQRLVRDLRIIENLRLYEHVDDIKFLRELANDPDLFGDEMSP